MSEDRPHYATVHINETVEVEPQLSFHCPECHKIMVTTSDPANPRRHHLQCYDPHCSDRVYRVPVFHLQVVNA